jgi:hypothetical protein
MSDFLTLLASRVLGLAPVLQPRLPSRFEPVQPIHAPDDTVLEVLGEVEQTPGMAARMRRRSEATVARMAVQQTPQASAVTAPSSVGANSRPEPTRQEGTAVHPLQTDAAPVRPLPARVAEHRGDAPPQPVAALPQAEVPPLSGTAGLPAPEAEPVQAAPQPRPALLRPAAQHPEPPRLLEAPIRQVTTPGPPLDDALLHEATEPVAGRPGGAATPQRRVAAPAAVPPLRRPEGFSGAPPARALRAETPVPAVRVTIGRIEVRAAPLTEQVAPSPAPRRPGLSLSEYLRDRDGAGP